MASPMALLTANSTPTVRRTIGCLVVALLFAGETTFGESTGGPGGAWPKSWPTELEPFREKAWTWEEGLIASPCYDIAFENREEFEAVWPHILSLKSKGAPVTLLRGDHVRVWTTRPPKNQSAGVIIRPALPGHDKGTLSTTRIYLVVDGDTVDLNRIRLPANSPIIDKRFMEKRPISEKPKIQKVAPPKKAAPAAAPAPAAGPAR